MAKRQHVLERDKDKVIGLVLDGLSDAAVAAAMSDKRVSVTRQAVTAFRHRHADILLPAREEAVKQAADYAIAQKVERIAAMNNRWSLLHQVILARAADKRYSEPGYATGLMVHDVKAVGSGEGADLVDVFKVDTGLLAEIRNLEKAAAEELGQLPRPEVNIDNRTQVLIREYAGWPAALQ